MNSRFINGISVNLLTQLFNAKCKDLGITPKEGQLKRFYDFCSSAIKGRKLIFREIGFGPHSAKILGNILRFNKFSHLDLRKNMLGNKGLKELSKSINSNCSLIHIDIGSNDITFEGANSFFISLKKHKTLSSINIANNDGLHRNRIGAKGCIGLNELLQKNKLISMINISDNYLGREGVKTLLNSLKPSNINLLYLNLTNNDLGPDCISDLKVLLECPTLQELRLANNKLDDVSAEALSLFLYKQVCQIQKIDLSRNKITSKGASLLFQSIKQNLFMTHLNFEDNSQLGNGNLRELEHFFNNNQTLTHLNMSGCGIESWHVKGMVDGLYAKQTVSSRTGNNSLQILNLSNNKIDGEGVKYLVEIIENDTNTGLRNIDLSRNNISDDAGVALAKALETNTCLKKFSLQNNFLNDESGEAFVE